MKKKIIWGLAILVLISGGVFVYVRLQNPPSEYPYNASMAREDIKKGEIWLVSFGLPMIFGPELDSISMKYGFREHSLGCVPGELGSTKGIHRYNEIMEEWLEKKNGIGWQKKYNKDIEDYLQKKRKKNDETYGVANQPG